MDKANWFVLKVILGGILFLFIIFGLVYFWAIKPAIVKDNQLRQWCESKNIDINNCDYYSLPKCYNDCESLGLQYMRIESGGYGYDNLNCWCKEGNVTKQIW